MDSINAPLLLNVFRRIEGKGVYETAHRTLNTCSQVFRYAIIKGDATRDPTADLRGALITPGENHFATITNPKEIAALLRACDGYDGSEMVRTALLLLPMVFVRPGELRHMEWTEVDFDNARWTIPAEKMKAKRIHVVPLSKQALELLQRLFKYTGNVRYAFPSIRTPAGNKSMSDNTINAALRRLGYSTDDLTAHGFRAMASTLLYERGWPGDVIEIQLAHQERNKVKAAYNHAQYMDKRREMMQWWADYLHELKTGA
ncbi:MAG: site-specific integrase [Synergistaceae bacterium]|nr:site-specific integrase [Synergistaceae bacterium]